MVDLFSLKSKIEKNTSRIIESFFEQLELNDYLKETDPLRSLTGVAMKNIHMLRIIHALDIDIENPQSELLKIVKEHGLEDYDYYILYYTLIIHLWLDQIEFTKSMIQSFLTPKAKEECAINDKEPLGILLNKLNKKIPTKDFAKLMDIDFRNILAHGKWWIQMENFCFEDNNKKIHFLEKQDFLMKQVQFVAFTIGFGNALKKYFLY